MLFIHPAILFPLPIPWNPLEFLWECHGKGDRALRRSASGWPALCGLFAFVQERFHSLSPGDLESTCIKAGGSETKGLGEKKRQERDGAQLPRLPRIHGREGSPGGAAASSLESPRKGGPPGDRFRV